MQGLVKPFHVAAFLVALFLVSYLMAEFVVFPKVEDSFCQTLASEVSESRYQAVTDELISVRSQQAVWTQADLDKLYMTTDKIIAENTNSRDDWRRYVEFPFVESESEIELAESDFAASAYPAILEKGRTNAKSVCLSVLR